MTRRPARTDGWRESRRFAQERSAGEVWRTAMQSPVAVERLKRIVTARFIDDPGQDLLEYALLVGLIAVVAVASVSTLGTVIYTIFWNNIATNF